MYIETVDYKTGWSGIKINIRKHEIDTLIEQLRQLRNNDKNHFHLMNDFTGKMGVGDIEFNMSEEGKDNMTISGLPIPPNR